MNRTAILEQIQKNVERLSAPDLPEYKYIPLHQKPSPSVATLHEIMRLLRTVIFPGFFGTEQEAQLGSIIRESIWKRSMISCKSKYIMDFVLR